MVPSLTTETKITARNEKAKITSQEPKSVGGDEKKTRRQPDASKVQESGREGHRSMSSCQVDRKTGEWMGRWYMWCWLRMDGSAEAKARISRSIGYRDP